MDIGSDGRLKRRLFVVVWFGREEVRDFWLGSLVVRVVLVGRSRRVG